MTNEDAVDWNYWSKLQSVKVFEAIALLNDTVPGEYPPSHDDASKDYRRTLRLLLDALSDRKQFSAGALDMGEPALHGVKLAEVGRWALVNGFTLPQGFRSRVLAVRKAANGRAPIDWSFWRHMPEVKQWQACALSLNINPDSMKPHPQAWMAGQGSRLTFADGSFMDAAERAEFEKRERLLDANLFNSGFFKKVGRLVKGGRHLATIALPEFVAWGVHVGLDAMPPELLSFAVAERKLPFVAEVAPTMTAHDVGAPHRSPPTPLPKDEADVLRRCLSLLAEMHSPNERRTMAANIEKRINGESSALLSFRFTQLAALFYPGDKEKIGKLEQQMQAAADTGELATIIPSSEKGAMLSDLAVWPNCPPIPAASPLRYWLPHMPLPESESAGPPHAQITSKQTKEQRQAERYQLCVARGLQMPSDDYAHLPRGIGAVADELGITRQAFSEDVKAHIRRIAGCR